MKLLDAALPGPLPDGFAELAATVYAGDPMWIPEDPAALQAACSPENPWFGRGVAHAWAVPGAARIAAFHDPAAQVDGEPTVFFGLWESRGEREADTALFTAVESWAAQWDVGRIFGPVDFTTFGRYRLRVAAEPGAVTYPAEPYNPPTYPAILEGLGFTPRHHYNTRILDLTPELLGGLVAGAAPAEERYLAGGYRFEPLDTATWLGRLREFHGLVDATFGHNFAYTPLDFATFARLCGSSYVAKADPDASGVAYDPDGAVAGFVLAYPQFGPLVVAGAGLARRQADSLDATADLAALAAATAPDRPDVIMKTVGLRPDHQRQGFQFAFYASIWRRELERARYRKAFLALSRDDNPTQGLVADVDHNTRWYVLYERPVAGSQPA